MTLAGTQVHSGYTLHFPPPENFHTGKPVLFGQHGGTITITKLQDRSVTPTSPQCPLCPRQHPRHAGRLAPTSQEPLHSSQPLGRRCCKRGQTGCGVPSLPGRSRPGIWGFTGCNPTPGLLAGLAGLSQVQTERPVSLTVAVSTPLSIDGSSSHLSCTMSGAHMHNVECTWAVTHAQHHVWRCSKNNSSLPRCVGRARAGCPALGLHRCSLLTFPFSR